METILKVHQLAKSYGETVVLDNLTFTIGRGNLFSILGPNGAGKSTLISLILGLELADSGTITLRGEEISQSATVHKKSLAVVFQQSILDEDLTVEDNLTIRAYFYVNNWAEAKKLALSKLEDVEGSELLRKKYGVLSGGERRKVDIARALLNNPQLLFLDEPTSGLDIIARAGMWRLIYQLKEQYQMTVVLTTHYMEEARDSDQVLMLMNGQIVAYDHPRQLKKQYQVATLEDVFLQVATQEGVRE